jgi:hypothetical protein
MAPWFDSIDLEPGEQILATARASFRGAAATSAKSTFALGSGRIRMRAFDVWFDAARASGFPDTPPDMYLTATDRRILVGKPRFWGGAPARYTGELDYEKIGRVVAVRHGLVTGVAFAFQFGGIVELEAVRGRKLRHFADVVSDRLAELA